MILMLHCYLTRIYQLKKQLKYIFWRTLESGVWYCSRCMFYIQVLSTQWLLINCRNAANRIPPLFENSGRDGMLSTHWNFLNFVLSSVLLLQLQAANKHFWKLNEDMLYPEMATPHYSRISKGKTISKAFGHVSLFHELFVQFLLLFVLFVLCEQVAKSLEN